MKTIIQSGKSSVALALIFFSTSLASVHAESWLSGLTEPINDVTLSAPVVGIVSARPLSEGAALKKGDIAVELDHKLEELDVQRKKIIRDAAEAEFNRLKELAQRNAISVSKEESAKKEAEFKVAEVEYDLAKEQLQKRLLIAPFDGTIADLFVKVGESCEARQPVVRIVDTRRCYFVGNVEAKLGHNLKEGAPVTLQVEAGASFITLDGKISFVSPVVDPASGLQKIKAVFDNSDARIRPGVAAKMKVSE